MLFMCWSELAPQPGVGTSKAGPWPDSLYQSERPSSLTNRPSPYGRLFSLVTAATSVYPRCLVIRSCRQRSRIGLFNHKITSGAIINAMPKIPSSQLKSIDRLAPPFGAPPAGIISRARWREHRHEHRHEHPSGDAVE